MIDNEDVDPLFGVCGGSKPQWLLVVGCGADPVLGRFSDLGSGPGIWEMSISSIDRAHILHHEAAQGFVFRVFVRLQEKMRLLCAVCENHERGE